MKRVNGIIVEATEDELQDVWLLSNWNKTASFDTFVRLMIEEGCTIIERGGVYQDYPMSSSVQDVPSTTSEQKQTVTVDQPEMEKQIVSDIDTTVPVQNSAINVDTKTPVGTKPMTATTGANKIPKIKRN